MISTRVMDIKLRESAEGLGEDSTGKKKSKFKTFKKFFGKKKRKESPSSTGNSTWKQNPAKSEVIAIESGPVGYDSEDELEESRGTLGSRALSHDSIFIPESGQDPARPVRVFSQENVCDRIKALQLKIQCHVKMGPPPPPGGLPAKRAEDTGMSSEDDGLPRSPPEMSLLHDVGPGMTIKVSLVSSSRPQSPEHTGDATNSSRTSDSSLAPVADFSCPPELSSCLDNSAAKHKLLVKPRNQRSSKMRRLSSRAQSESLCDLIGTPEEEEYDEKLFPQLSTEENPSSGQYDLMLHRDPEPRGLVTLLPPGGPRARRARLQHCPALSASVEDGLSPGDDVSNSLVIPEVIEPVAVSAPCLESPSQPESSLHPSSDHEIQRSEIQKRDEIQKDSEIQKMGKIQDSEIQKDNEIQKSGEIQKDNEIQKGVETQKDSEIQKMGEVQKDNEIQKRGEIQKDSEIQKRGDIQEDSEIQKRGDIQEDSEIQKRGEIQKDSEIQFRDEIQEDSEIQKREKIQKDSEIQKMEIQEENKIQESEIQKNSEIQDIEIQESEIQKVSEVQKEPPVAGPRPLVPGTAEEEVCASGEMGSPLVTCVSERNVAPAETVTTTITLETPSDPEGPGQRVQEEEGPALAVPGPNGAAGEPPALAPSPPMPKSCLKHRAASLSLAESPVQGAGQSPPRERSPGAPDAEAPRPARAKAERAESSQGAPERAAPGRKSGRGSGELRSVKKFSVSSSRARSRPSAARAPEPAGAPGPRLPLLRSSGLAWKSEAALDDLQGLPDPVVAKPDPPKPAECDPQDSGDIVGGQARPSRSPQKAKTTPSGAEAGPAAQEPPPSEDRNPFPVKLRSTSLSLKYREGPSQEAKGVKRHSAEVRLERGLTLPSKDEQGHTGATPALRGARSPTGPGKGKARAPEQLGFKPPLPRKPLLQSFTLPYSSVAPEASPGEPEKVTPPVDARKESRMAEKKSQHRGAEKSLPAGPGADGQPTPPWITMARQKRRGPPDQPLNQEDKPGVQILKPETGKQTKASDRAQEPVKQADFVRSKSFLMTPAKPTVTQKQGAKLSLKEGLQRGISLSHQNLAAQSAVMTEKELHQLKRASYASADQPSWMELARKKSQAWSDMPQIIK
ncbi:CRACD-like protein isoform X2 [Callospermophilus lateralis]|uniref:CRACD-like protein isoform X2 n=1 Tax=Callospermophilus lateralis TaxID=76772 RepID=UPI004038E375